MIYKIFRKTEWLDLKRYGTTSGAPVDIKDGYIHFSTSSQVRETLKKYFDGLDDLLIAAVDNEKITDHLKWELARKGQHFPHLYRKLKLKEIVWCEAIVLKNGKHILPSKIL